MAWENSLYGSSSFQNSLGSICVYFLLFLYIFVGINRHILHHPPLVFLCIFSSSLYLPGAIWCDCVIIQCVLQTGARLFPVVRVWKFPLHTPALSQGCCCSTAGQDTRSFPSPPKQGGGPPPCSRPCVLPPPGHNGLRVQRLSSQPLETWLTFAHTCDAVAAAVDYFELRHLTNVSYPTGVRSASSPLHLIDVDWVCVERVSQRFWTTTDLFVK